MWASMSLCCSGVKCDNTERLPVLICHYLYRDTFLLGLHDTIASSSCDQVSLQYNYNLSPLPFVQPETDPGILLLMD